MKTFASATRTCSGVSPQAAPLEAGKAHFPKSYSRKAFLALSGALAVGLNPRLGSQTLAEAPSRPVALLRGELDQQSRLCRKKACGPAEALLDRFLFFRSKRSFSMTTSPSCCSSPLTYMIASARGNRLQPRWQ